MEDISKKLEDLLVLLRSRNVKEVDALPTSPQLPESPDCDRPESKPNYSIKALKASSPLCNRAIKLHQRISFEEIEERRSKGLCLFCEESETPDHYLRHKNSGILMIDCDEDHTLNDEEWVETEIATESNGIEVNKQRQFHVPVSDSESLRSIEPGKVDLGLENQERKVLNDNLEQEWVQKNISKRFEVEGDVERGHKVQSMEKICSAHQVFGKMSRHETLGIKKKRKGFKSWRFKFKQRKQHKGKLRSAHQLIHRGNVMYKYLCSSAKVALMKKNKFSTTWSTLKVGCFLEDYQVYQKTLPLWLLIRLKFMNKNLQKMMREHGNSSHLKLKSDVGEDDEMFTEAKAVSMRFLLGIMLGIPKSDAGQEQQAVCEQIIMVNVWLNQISLVLQQAMRNKRIRLSKRWWFKYRFDEEDQGSLQSRAGYSLSRREMLTFISQAKALLFESKDWREKQIPTLHINVSQYRWTQEVFAVIRFLLRRHLHLNLDCEEPELAERKRNHGLFTRFHSKHKQRKCPKSWMFKFKTGSKHAGTSHILHQHKKPTNWSTQTVFGSAGYHVWHRWKARYCFVGIISTMWAWLFGEGGFDIGK